jgi:hypothetical protein
VAAATAPRRRAGMRKMVPFTVWDPQDTWDG